MYNPIFDGQFTREHAQLLIDKSTPMEISICGWATTCP